jgi:hypothetical protein
MSFPCFAHPIPPELDDEFNLFVSARPGDVHNPWPQLVDLYTPGSAWSLPLVRSLYIPTTYTPDKLMEDFAKKRLPLIWRILVVHEAAHVILNSPAKEWARVCLAWALDQVGTLLDGDIPSWYSFVTMNNLFREVCGQMRLAEELLVTALSFRALEIEEPTETEKWEEYCVTEQNKMLPGFSKLYYGGFKKVVQLLAVPLGDANS